jgi:hypothetical protein
MEDAQKQGFTWAEYFARGTVPLPQVALFERAWNLLIQVRTDRADREGHPMDVDPETGEVIETPTESPEKASQSPESPSWYDVHPQGEFVTLDPDEDLPF